MGDYQARFCERLEGKFLRPTRQSPHIKSSAIVKQKEKENSLRDSAIVMKDF